MTGVLADSSAIVEILADLPGAVRMRETLFGSLSAHATPVAFVEAGFVMVGRMGWRTATFRKAFEALDLGELAIDAETGRLALDCFERFGRGRHPARLNFGDCLSYAAAQRHGLKLLFIGEDFAKTDVAVA